MHATIDFNNSITTVLDYNEEKVKQQLAECIASENFIKDTSSLTYADKLYRFQQHASLNDTIERKMFHSVLRFGASERLSNDTISLVAREYLQGMGFGDQPFLVYRHLDTSIPHAHLVSSTIDRDGNRISLSRASFFRSYQLATRLTNKYGLQPNYLDLPDTGTAEKIQHGISPLFPSINRILEAVIPVYKYTDLAELNAILRLYNMEADRGKEHTVTYKNQGLHYHPLKADGSRAYEYYPASSFPSKPTLPNLEKRFLENRALRHQHRDRLATAIDYTLAGATLSLDALKQALVKRKISVVTGEDKTATPQIWYIDHQNKTVFEGATLGSDYSFGAMQKRLVSAKTWQQQQETLHQSHQHRHSL